MGYTFRELYNADLQRGAYGYWRKLVKYLRRCQTTKNKILLLYYRWRLKMVREKHHIEISGKCDIGPGLFLGHVFCITINSKAKIGKNCCIHKGVTIGKENRGERAGCPTIGDSVWIGVNASIVGRVTIGDDVLIAPNTFVNCDVPSHSVVFGNPCIIKHRDWATERYVDNKCNL